MMDDAERARWLAERCGKLTASKMAVAMSFLKNGKPTAERTRYMQELLAERVTGYSVRHFVTPAMEHGLQYEDEGKAEYEARTGRLLVESRFYEHPSIPDWGATPDAEIDDDGLLEIKCPTTPTFIAWTVAGLVPPEHQPQMLAQIACTGRRWCEFVAYDPRIVDPERRLFVRRFVPTPEQLGEVERAAVAFLAELDTMFEQFTSGAAA